MISYPQFLLWWIPNRADTRKGKMKLNEIIFTLSMGGMLLMLTMMVLGFGL